MTERNMTTTELARVTALSQTTIRQIRKGTGTHHGHALIALSAALGWPPQYFREVAVGKQPSVPAAPVARIERKLDSLLARFEWLASEMTAP